MANPKCQSILVLLFFLVDSGKGAMSNFIYPEWNNSTKPESKITGKSHDQLDGAMFFVPFSRRASDDGRLPKYLWNAP